MLTLITSILPFAFKIIGYFIDKKITDKKERQEARKRFLGFLQYIEPALNDSARLRRSSQSQRERLEQQIAELEGGENV